MTRTVVVERVGVLVPHPIEQFLTADDGALRGHQRLENAELLAGEIDQLAAAALTVRLEESSSMSPAVRTGGAAGVVRRTQGADAGYEFLERERLGEVVVGAECET